MPPISVWILGDQLLENHPAIAAAAELCTADELQIVLIESRARIRKMPYQRKKLVLLLSAMDHYAQELRDRGYHVDLIRAENAIAGLRRHVQSHQPERIVTMAAAEYRGRRFQQEELEDAVGVSVTVVDNTQMILGRFNPHPHPEPGKRVVMENFYRAMRRHFDVLMDGDGEPAGGAWNFDKENRKPLPKAGLKSPRPLTFPPDERTRAVMADVAELDGCIGDADGFDLAVTRGQAQAAFNDFLDNRLATFGPYEDAMSRTNAILFHSTLSPYMNIGLLDPLQMVRMAEDAYRAGDAPINSVEGFVRQILGWREFIYWQYWRQMPDLPAANAWEHSRALPDFFWTGATDMACLSTVIDRVLASGYSHHIERLMVICNFCMLAGIDPAHVNDWFLSAYVDAYEWVVTPNVIGMGLNADGGITATKPYISSANYINKMSDFCSGCRFDHKARTGEDACPFNYLYWAFLLKNEETLRSNPRFGPAVLGLRHLDDDQRNAVRRQAADFLEGLEAA